MIKSYQEEAGMEARISTFRVGGGGAADVGDGEVAHELGLLWAALSREPGHVAGYAIRVDAATVVAVNLFARAEEADAGMGAVRPRFDALVEAVGLELVGTAAGPAQDVRWSLT